MKHYKKAMQYMSKHPAYNATIHALGGLGVGLLIARPLVVHPLRTGIILIALSLLGHIYAWMSK